MKRCVLICCSLLLSPAVCSCSVSSADETTSPDLEKIKAGERLFEKEWSFDDFDDPFLEGVIVQPSANEIGDGLGPLHNATSCAACHQHGGAAGVGQNVIVITIDPRSPIFKQEHQTGAGRRQLLKFYPGVFTSSGAVSLDTVLHNASTRPGYQELRKHIQSLVREFGSDAWFEPELRSSEILAEAPVLAGRMEDIDFYLSQRNPPPLFGLGAIDAIPMDALKVLAKRQARRSRGSISGRVGAGKFGWRAQTDTLGNFVRGACTGELGLSTSTVRQPLDPVDFDYQNPGFDISGEECDQISAYLESLEPPSLQRQVPRNTVVKLGEQQFSRLGCADCHVRDIGDTKNLFSDLLLHDMGARLQAPSPAPLGSELGDAPRMTLKSFMPSGRAVSTGLSIGGYYGTPPNRYPFPLEFVRPDRPQFPYGEIDELRLNPQTPEDVSWDALQREWRTPPLWGLADSGPYLHDGRATTIEEAILWHGGEAEESAAAYRRMSANNRTRILTFLNSLFAPPRLDPMSVAWAEGVENRPE